MQTPHLTHGSALSEVEYREAKEENKLKDVFEGDCNIASLRNLRFYKQSTVDHGDRTDLNCTGPLYADLKQNNKVLIMTTHRVWP